MMIFVFLAAFCLTGTMAASGTVLGPVDSKCMRCICEGASNCDSTAGCVGEICGLFKITRPFWIDAGSPVISLDSSMSSDAYVRCTMDPFCAAQAVQQYINRFKQDCNGDGKIDCIDYASIHQLGGYGCNSGRPWNHQFETQFYKCMKNGKTG